MRGGARGGLRPAGVAVSAALALTVTAACAGAGSTGSDAAGRQPAGRAQPTGQATVGDRTQAGSTSGAHARPAVGQPTARRPCGFGAPAGYRHVIWIWMENRSYSSVLGSSGGAPHLQHYANRCGVATDYWAITHPSLPNYIAATAGRTFGITTDCSPDTCSFRRTSLFEQVQDAGLGWKGYAESMLQACDQRSYGSYAARHNPAVYFPPIHRACVHRDRVMGGPHGRFARALNKGPLPAFSFVTPNLCHDGHDCTTSVADDWLGAWLRRIVNSPAYADGRTVVFVTWDEGVVDNHVATVVVGPSVPRGTRAKRHLTHYSLLRTTEELLHLHLLHNAKSARSMTNAFNLR